MAQLPRAVLHPVGRRTGCPQPGLAISSIREPLPEIPIPLADRDPDVRVDLQRLLHGIYDAAGYDRFIYTAEPDPPLRGDDATWARALVPAGARQPAAG